MGRYYLPRSAPCQSSRCGPGEFVDLAAKACHQPMLDTTFITINPHILGGTPVFAGTRVSVRILFEYIETGETLAEFFG
jgi:Protein of unknown function (DUF433)